MKKRILARVLSVLMCITMATSMDAMALMPVMAATEDTVIVEDITEENVELVEELEQEDSSVETTEISDEEVEDILAEADAVSDDEEEIVADGAELASLVVDTEDYTLTEDTVVNGNVTVSNGKKLILNGKKLTVQGDVVVTGASELNAINSSFLVNGSVTYSDGDTAVAASFYTSESSVVVIDGDFIWNSSSDLMGYYPYSSHIAAGTMNLKGDYIDKFGTEFFGTLYLKGVDSQKIQMKKESLIDTVKSDNADIVADIFNVTNLGSNITIEGSTAVYKDINLNKYKLTIKKDLLQRAILNVIGSTLSVGGDLTFSDGDTAISAILATDESSLIYIDGNFVWNSNKRLMGCVRYASIVPGGTMYLKGDYLDKFGSEFYGKLVMLSPKATISSKGKIKELVLSGPLSGYTFPEGECYENIEMQATTLEIAVGQKYDVAPFFEGVKNIKKYKVTSTDGGKATINKKGLLTAKKPGSITVSAILTNGKTYDKNVALVIKKPAYTTKLPTATFVGQTISANELMQNIPEGNEIKWTSSKESVAKIDAKTGEITAVGSGKTKINLIITNAQEKSVTIKATLTVKIPKIAETLNLKVGKKKTLALKNVAKNTNVEWKVEKDGIVEKTEKGTKLTLIGLATGTTKVTAVVDGHEYSTIVTVE